MKKSYNQIKKAWSMHVWKKIPDEKKQEFLRLIEEEFESIGITDPKEIQEYTDIWIEDNDDLRSIREWKKLIDNIGPFKQVVTASKNYRHKKGEIMKKSYNQLKKKAEEDWYEKVFLPAIMDAGKKASTRVEAIENIESARVTNEYDSVLDILYKMADKEYKKILVELADCASKKTAEESKLEGLEMQIKEKIKEGDYPEELIPGTRYYYKMPGQPYAYGPTRGEADDLCEFVELMQEQFGDMPDQIWKASSKKIAEAVFDEEEFQQEVANMNMRDLFNLEMNLESDLDEGHTKPNDWKRLEIINKEMKKRQKSEEYAELLSTLKRGVKKNMKSYNKIKSMYNIPSGELAEKYKGFNIMEMEDKSMGISTATLNVTVFPRFGSVEESKQWIDNLTPEQRKKYYLSSKKTAVTTDLEGLKKQLSKEEFEELFSGGNLTPWVDYKIGGFAIMFDPEKAVYHIGWYKDMSRKTAKKWKVVLIDKGKQIDKIIELGTVSNKDDVKEQLKRMGVGGEIISITEASKKTAQPTIQDQLTGKLPATQTGQEKEDSEEEEPKEMEEGGMAGEGELPADELDKDEFFPEEEKPKGIPDKAPEEEAISKMTSMDFDIYTALVKQRRDSEAQMDLDSSKNFSHQIENLIAKYQEDYTPGEISPEASMARRMKAHTMLNRDDYQEFSIKANDKLFEVFENMPYNIIGASILKIASEDEHKVIDMSIRITPIGEEIQRDITIRMNSYDNGENIKFHPYFWDTQNKRYGFEELGFKEMFGLVDTEALSNLEAE